MPGILLSIEQKVILESVATLTVNSVPNLPTLIYWTIPSVSKHIPCDQSYMQIHKTEMAWSLPRDTKQVMQTRCNLYRMLWVHWENVVDAIERSYEEER